MKYVSILVPEGALVSSIDGVHELLLEANNFFGEKELELPFHIQIVANKKEVKLKNGLFSVNALLLDEVLHSDIIIIPPAYQNDFVETINVNNDIVNWLAKQYEGGSEIAALCISSVLLASTGLLNGRRCSTNWMVSKDFKSLFPLVKVVVDKVITDENRIYTSGGGYSYLNLILYLIEKYGDREAAIHCAKVYQIDLERTSQSPFIIFKGQKSHGDEVVKKAQEFVESSFRNGVTIEGVASEVCLGKRSLELRFKKATSITLGNYIQHVKVEGAKRDFELTRKNVNEVMADIGYTDSKAFRAMFKKITGLTPTAYRAKYWRAKPVHLN